jgi:hypothetical protein
MAIFEQFFDMLALAKIGIPNLSLPVVSGNMTSHVMSTLLSRVI